MKTTSHGDSIRARMERDAIILSRAYGFEASPYLQPGQPRWRLGVRWIEFECGCRAERCAKLIAPKKYDPIIFEGLPEQAVYDGVCDAHQQGMWENRIRFWIFDDHNVETAENRKFEKVRGYADFNDWHRRRRPLLMGA